MFHARFLQKNLTEYARLLTSYAHLINASDDVRRLRALAADLRSGEVMVGSKAGRSSLAGARWSGVVQIGRAARGEGEPSVFRLASGLYLSLFVGKRTRTGRLRRILLPLSAAGITLEVRWMKAHSGLRTPRTTNF